MYADYFGMRELPFTLTPNTHFYLQLPTHQEAFNLLMVGLQNGDGFIKVIGEVGTGKTMLCRTLLNALENDEYLTAYLPSPQLTPEALHRNFALELGVDNALDAPEFELLKLISHRLIEIAGSGKKTVLIVDEAQAMPEETIEALRLLTNIETESEKLFQVVLFGQPELDLMLDRNSLRQLKQRITFSCRLKALTPTEVELYIAQRVNKSGCERLNLFSRQAALMIGRASKGIPRVVNTLAHKALMVAYGLGEAQVTRKHVARAVADTEGVQLALFDQSNVLGALAFGIGALAVVALFIVQRGALL